MKKKKSLGFLKNIIHVSDVSDINLVLKYYRIGIITCLIALIVDDVPEARVSAHLST